MDGWPVQMLVNIGCDWTIVSALIVKTAKLEPGSKIPVLCVHGDSCFHPTATMKLASGSWSKEATVAVALICLLLSCWGRMSMRDLVKSQSR